jgi:hypothetical protein
MIPLDTAVALKAPHQRVGTGKGPLLLNGTSGANGFNGINQVSATLTRAAAIGSGDIDALDSSDGAAEGAGSSGFPEFAGLVSGAFRSRNRRA